MANGNNNPDKKPEELDLENMEALSADDAGGETEEQAYKRIFDRRRQIDRDLRASGVLPAESEQNEEPEDEDKPTYH